MGAIEGDAVEFGRQLIFSFHLALPHQNVAEIAFALLQIVEIIPLKSDVKLMRQIVQRQGIRFDEVIKNEAKIVFDIAHLEPGRVADEQKTAAALHELNHGQHLFLGKCFQRGNDHKGTHTPQLAGKVARTVGEQLVATRRKTAVERGNFGHGEIVAMRHIQQHPPRANRWFIHKRALAGWDDIGNVSGRIDRRGGALGGTAEPIIIDITQPCRHNSQQQQDNQ